MTLRLDHGLGDLGRIDLCRSGSDVRLARDELARRGRRGGLGGRAGYRRRVDMVGGRGRGRCVDGGTVSAGPLARRMARCDLRRGCRPRASSHHWGAGCIAGAKSSWAAGGSVPTIRCGRCVSVSREAPCRLSCTVHVDACALAADAVPCPIGRWQRRRPQDWSRGRAAGHGAADWPEWASRSKGASKVSLTGRPRLSGSTSS